MRIAHYPRKPQSRRKSDKAELGSLSSSQVNRCFLSPSCSTGGTSLRPTSCDHRHPRHLCLDRQSCDTTNPADPAKSVPSSIPFVITAAAQSQGYMLYGRYQSGGYLEASRITTSPTMRQTSNQADRWSGHPLLGAKLCTPEGPPTSSKPCLQVLKIMPRLGYPWLVET